MIQEYFQIGAITSTHGLKGEVKVFPTTEDKSRFEILDEVLIEEKDGYKKLNIRNVRYFKNMIILSFKQYDDINQVEYLKGKKIFISRKDAIELSENEYYVPDLIGLNVFDEANVKIGTLTDVIFTGANDVYVIKAEDGRELMIPAIKECIISVDIENETMIIHVMDGLFEIV